MKILVTGAGGFIGGALAKGLLQMGGDEVIGIGRSAAADAPLQGLQWYSCDLSKNLPPEEEVDYIVHCAAAQNYMNMPARDFIDVNLSMAENVCIYGKKVGVKGLIFTSSISLHGDVRADVIDESTDRINPSLYGLSKHLCELVLQGYQSYFPSIALRLCGVVGPGAKGVWLARVLAKALAGEPIPIVNADRPFNNVVHTGDLLCFISSVMAKGFSGFHAFPVASASPLAVRDVVAGIVNAAHSSSVIVDNGNSGPSFTISNDYAAVRFQYRPSAVAENLRKFTREMS